MSVNYKLSNDTTIMYFKKTEPGTENDMPFFVLAQ